MCLEWLNRLSETGGKLICLVRATDEAAARRRLASVFEGADPELEQRFRDLARDHLEVVVGDVAEPRLGLSRRRLRSPRPGRRPHLPPGRAGQPRARLRGPVRSQRRRHRRTGPAGVDPPAEALRLRVVGGDDVSARSQRGEATRRSPLRPKIALTGHYSNGYGSSKWAAEHVLHSAHRRFGLPVNVFRGDMMLAHRTYHQQINVADIFTRLLCSVVLTGLAPESFYRLEPDGSRPRAHYDGLPVDFLAAAIVGISVEPHEEIRTFHVLNHHDDGTRSTPSSTGSRKPATSSSGCRTTPTGSIDFEAKLRGAAGGPAPALVAQRPRVAEPSARPTSRWSAASDSRTPCARCRSVPRSRS